MQMRLSYSVSFVLVIESVAPQTEFQPQGTLQRMMNPPPNSVHPQTLAEWRAWLEQNHTRKEGVWLISYKKATGKRSFDYADSVEEALCFGWIDSKGNKLDEERTMLWFAPRNPGTGWSAPNKRRVESLMATGRMAPAGMAKIEAAKQDGSWTALDAVEALEIPPDLAQALAANPTAQQYFDTFSAFGETGNSGVDFDCQTGGDEGQSRCGNCPVGI